MTEAELHALFDYWRDALGLQGWQLELAKGGCDADSYMEVDRSVTYDRARVKWQPWLIEGDVPDALSYVAIDDEFIEASLVHELLHLHTRDMSTVVTHDLDGFLHRDVHSQVKSAFSRADEKCVDGLAVALVRHRRRWAESTDARAAAAQFFTSINGSSRS